MMMDQLASRLGLGELLDTVSRSVGPYDVIDHWTQGEFHHDLLIRIHRQPECLPGDILVIATNCNGGVKELLCFNELPNQNALWHDRCPNSTEFSGTLPPVLERRRTIHWFDPCTLLEPDAYSEFKPEFRERQTGGGWQPKRCGVDNKT